MNLFQSRLKSICLTVLAMTILLCTAAAQEQFSGKVYRTNSQEIIPGVNIKNIRTGNFTRSDFDGNFRIYTGGNDKIVFSSAGYVQDTISLGSYNLKEKNNVYLKPNVMKLADVEVDEMNRYEQDSINRRNDYAWLFEKKNMATPINKKQQGDAPGFSFSPISYGSKNEKQKRELLKRIQQEDEEEYIDAKFSRSRIAQLTHLRGDTLRIFMFWYRPSYEYCRSATKMDMLLYINDKFIGFKQRNYGQPE